MGLPRSLSGVADRGLARRRRAVRPRLDALEDRVVLSISLAGSEFQVDSSDPHLANDQRAPAVAMDAAGDFVVVWTDTLNNNNIYGRYGEIRAQRYNAAGVAQGAEIVVNSSATPMPLSGNGTSANANNFVIRESPAVAMDAAGDFVVSWTYSAPTASLAAPYYYDIFARGFNAAGTAQSNEFRVNASHVAAPNATVNHLGHSSVAMDATGDFVVAWDDPLSAGVDTFARRFNSSDTAQDASDVRVSTTTLDSNHTNSRPQVAMNGSQFVIAWDATNRASGTSGSDVAARRFQFSNFGALSMKSTPAGSSTTSDLVVSSNTTASEAIPHLAMNTTGQFVVAWQESGEGGSNVGIDISAKQFDSSGNSLDAGDVLVDNTTAGDQSLSSVGVDSTGNAIVTWASHASGTGTELGLFTRRLNAAGSTVEAADLQVAAPSQGSATDETAPAVASDLNGDAAVVWQAAGHSGDGNFGIFGQRVVRVNDAPSFTKGLDQTVAENSGADSVPNWATNISAGGSDESGQTVNFLISSNSNAGLFSVEPAISPTGTLTFTPATNASGSATVAVKIHDNGGTANGGIDTSAAQTFTITVNAVVNHAPTIDAISDLTVLENATIQTVNLTGITDGPGDSGQTITITASSDNTGLIPTPGITYTSPNNTGTLSFTPAANSFGTAHVTVTVKDNGGTANGGHDTTTTMFMITVTHVNQAPTIDAISDQTLNENAPQQTVNLTGITDGPGDTGQTITVSATSDNTGLIPTPVVTYTSPNATGTLTYTPNANSFGVAHITVTVKDDGGTANSGHDTTTRSFTVTVNQTSATITDQSVHWGTVGTAPLLTAGDGLRLLPAGRTTDLPWLNINKISITLSQAESLSPSDVTVHGISADYGPVTISGSGTNYTIILSQPIAAADKVTVVIGNAQISTFTRRLDVLPGDFNDDGVVTSADTVGINNATAEPYNVFADLNGDGVVDINDVRIARSRNGQRLPT
jgi:hypothetical protein